MSNRVRIINGLHGLKLDKKNFNKTFQANAERLIRLAATEWFRTMITHIPVWTGMALGGVVFAKGTNGFLYRYLRQKIPTMNVKDRPKWYRHSDGRRFLKTPENGGRLARYSFASAQKRYTFLFRSDVIHFIINDFFASPIPTQIPAPWGSLDAATVVFKLYIKDNWKRLLPKLKDYFFTERQQLTTE